MTQTINIDLIYKAGQEFKNNGDKNVLAKLILDHIQADHYNESVKTVFEAYLKNELPVPPVLKEVNSTNYKELLQCFVAGILAK